MSDQALGNSGGADIDAELEQFAMDVGRTPEWIVTTHLPDKIPDLAGNGRPARLPVANLPRPDEAKSLAMPAGHRLWFDDGQRRAPVAPDSGKKYPQEPVCWSQARTFLGSAPQNSDLVSQCEIFDLNCRPGTEHGP